MDAITEARAVAHTYSILYAGLNELSQPKHLASMRQRPNRALGIATLARLFHMAPETMATAHRYPTSLESMRSGLLRIRVPEAQEILFNQAWWKVQWIPSREPMLTQPAWNHLYEKAQERNLLTYFRKKWYSQLSYDMERLPVLVVDLVARAVGYPCGLAVRDPGSTIYDKRAQLLSKPQPHRTVDDYLASMPNLEAAWSDPKGPDDYFLTHPYTLDKQPNM